MLSTQTVSLFPDHIVITQGNVTIYIHSYTKRITVAIVVFFC